MPLDPELIQIRDAVGQLPVGAGNSVTADLMFIVVAVVRAVKNLGLGSRRAVRRGLGRENQIPFQNASATPLSRARPSWCLLAVGMITAFRSVISGPGMQMGRWFGYRTGYLDATCLYTTPELIKYYVHITRASRELMDLTSAVAKAGDTPRDVGLRVLDGVGNLQVTAAAKMRSLATMSISFSGQRAETLVMSKDKGPMARNFAKLEDLVSQILQYPEVPGERLHGGGRGLFREDVPADAVLDSFRSRRQPADR